MSFLQSPPAIMPQEQIIHVAPITSKAKVLFHVTVQPTQMEISEVLRGQAADRPTGSQFAAVSRDNPIQEFQEPAILESTFQKVHQPGMRHAVEVFAYIQFQEPSVIPCEVLSPQNRRLPSLALPTGEPIVDQPAIEDRLADVHDRMMQHALVEARGRDHPLFGIPDQELLESTDRERPFAMAADMAAIRWPRLAANRRTTACPRRPRAAL